MISIEAGPGIGSMVVPNSERRCGTKVEDPLNSQVTRMAETQIYS